MTQRLFISYSHRDARYLDRLHVHLAQAMRQGVFQGWYDREISAGANIDDEVSRELELADIFIALVSPDFIDSDYCYNRELRQALERRAEGAMAVVPVIVEACDWKSTPLGVLKALPSDAKPVAEWTNENVALLDVVQGLRELAGRKAPVAVKGDNQRNAVVSTDQTEPAEPARKFRAKRKFTRIDKDEYADTAFKEIKRFLERSVAELNRVEGLRGRVVVHSAFKVSCSVENPGYGREETVWIRRGGPLGDINIAYGRFGGDPGDNTANGGFSVEADDYEMRLASLMFHFTSDRQGLEPEDAARMIWEDLLQHVGIEGG